MASPRAERENATKSFNVLVKIWLRSFAIYSSTSWRVSLLKGVHRFLIQVLCIFILVGMVISLPRLPTYRLKTLMTSCIITPLIAGVTSFRVWCDELRLMAFFEDVLRSSKHLFGEKCFVRTMLRFRPVFAIAVPFLLYQFTASILVPILKNIFLRDFDEPFSYTVPFFLTCKHSNATAVDVDSLCWDVENYFQYFLKDTLLSFGILLFTVLFWVFLMFTTFLVIYVKMVVRVMREELNTLGEVVQKARQDGLRMGEDEMCKSLSDLIACYQEVHRIMNKIIPFLNLSTEYFLSVFCLLSLTLLAPIVKEPELISDVVYAAKSMGTLLVVFIGFSVFCYGGEIIKEMNWMIAEAVYDLPWYNESVGYRKQIYRFLLLLQRPCRVVAFYSIKTELRVSLITLYRMYSILNLILSRMR